MTLNNVVNRIKQIAQAHKQVRNFQQGLVSDFLTDHTTKYPSVFLQDNGGNISTSGHATTLAYRMFIMDLVHVSEGSKQNEQDVQSDMVSIAMDLIAQMNDGNYSDWKISTDNNLQLVVENENDLHAGCIVDFSVSIMFSQDRCQVPSDLVVDIENDTSMKTVFDVKYIASGSEGNALTSSGATPNIPEINGKKILFITREQSPIYKVSSSPDSAEYTWNDTDIILGTVTNPGERFLILYRNY